MYVEWLKLPSLVAGTALIATGIAIFFSGPHRRLDRRFALFLVVKGFLFAVLFLGGSVNDFGSRLRGYFAIATPFAALWFADAFREWAGGRRRIKGWLLLAILLPLMVLYAVAPRTGELQIHEISLSGSYLAFALLGALMLRESRHSEQTQPLRMAALAFALEPLYMGAFIVWGDLAGLAFHTSDFLAYQTSHWIVVVETITIYAATATALWVVLRGWQSRAGRTGIAMGRALVALPAIGLLNAALLFVPGITLHAYAWWPSSWFWLDVHWFVHSMTVLVSMAVLAYAILRFRLLGLDLALRGTVRQGILASAAILFFVIIAETLEQTVGQLLAGLNAQLASQVGALPVAIALAYLLYPVQRVAGRLATKAVPEEDWRSMPIDDRLNLYQEQVHLAARSGRLGEREHRMLARLQSGLGIDPAMGDPVLAHVADRH